MQPLKNSETSYLNANKMTLPLFAWKFHSFLLVFAIAIIVMVCVYLTF